MFVKQVDLIKNELNRISNDYLQESVGSTVKAWVIVVATVIGAILICAIVVVAIRLVVVRRKARSQWVSLQTFFRFYKIPFNLCVKKIVTVS